LAAINDGGEKSVMTEEEKEALRKSFAGKAVSQMTPEERKLFDEEFQYGFGNQPKQNLQSPNLLFEQYQQVQPCHFSNG